MKNPQLQIISRIEKGTCSISQKKDVECVLVERTGFPRQMININELTKFIRIVLIPIAAEPGQSQPIGMPVTKSSVQSSAISKQKGVTVGKSISQSSSSSDSHTRAETKTRT